MKSLSWSPDESRSPCWLSRSWGWPKIFPWKPPKRSSKREATLTTFRKRCSECFWNVLMRSETIETSTCWTPTTSRTTPVGVQAAGKTKRKWLVPTCYLWLIGAKMSKMSAMSLFQNMERRKGKSEWRMPWRPWLEPISQRCWHHDTMGSLLWRSSSWWLQILKNVYSFKQSRNIRVSSSIPIFYLKMIAQTCTAENIWPPALDGRLCLRPKISVQVTMPWWVSVACSSQEVHLVRYHVRILPRINGTDGRFQSDGNTMEISWGYFSINRRTPIVGWVI